MSVVKVLGGRMSVVTLLGVPSERSNSAGGAKVNVLTVLRAPNEHGYCAWGAE